MVPTLTPKLSEPAEEKYTALAGKMHKEQSNSSIAMNDKTQSVSTKTSDEFDGHDDHTRNIMIDQTDLNPRANMGFIQHRVLQKAKHDKKDWDEIAMVPTLTPKLSEPAEEKYTASAGKMHKEHSDSSIAMNDRTRSISTQTSNALDGHMLDQTDLNPRANMGFIQHR